MRYLKHRPHLVNGLQLIGKQLQCLPQLLRVFGALEQISITSTRSSSSSSDLQYGDFLKLISSTCANTLRLLNLTSCAYITDEQLFYLLRCCKKLKELSIVMCSFNGTALCNFLATEASQLITLKVDFLSYYEDRKGLERMLHCCSNLKRLIIDEYRYNRQGDNSEYYALRGLIESYGVVAANEDS